MINRRVNSIGNLTFPILVKSGEGEVVCFEHVGPLTGYLFMRRRTLRHDHPSLWEDAEKALEAATGDPVNLTKCRIASVAAYRLLKVAGLLADETRLLE